MSTRLRRELTAELMLKLNHHHQWHRSVVSMRIQKTVPTMTNFMCAMCMRTVHRARAITENADTYYGKHVPSIVVII